MTEGEIVGEAMRYLAMSHFVQVVFDFDFWF